MPKTYVLMGRFQPLHDGHKDLIRKTLNLAQPDEQVVILLGSANRPRSIKNPWTFQEREQKINEFLLSTGSYLDIHILPLNDYKYSDAQWCSDVVETVKSVVVNYLDEDIVLVGHMKKGNSYLKYFPQWKYHEVDTIVEINATDIREKMLQAHSKLMPASVRADWDYFSKERATFSNYPFKATLGFMCADVILECAGNILLIQRGRAPGQGTWALPGGFRNADETFLECGLRELIEETNVRVPEKVLRGNIVGVRLFDAPDRGCGIPRTTVAHHIRIEPEPDGSLPRANGADDAMECKWVPIAEVMNNYKLFDDHKDIIHIMTGATPIPAYLNPFI